MSMLWLKLFPSAQVGVNLFNAIGVWVVVSFGKPRAIKSGNALSTWARKPVDLRPTSTMGSRCRHSSHLPFHADVAENTQALNTGSCYDIAAPNNANCWFNLKNKGIKLACTQVRNLARPWANRNPTQFIEAAAGVQVTHCRQHWPIQLARHLGRAAKCGPYPRHDLDVQRPARLQK